MLDALEIKKEIARLEYEESSYPNYAKLADLYIIRAEMSKANETQRAMLTRKYSRAAAPERVNAILPQENTSSEFLNCLAGKPTEQVMSIMDELMDSLKVIQPRVYDAAIKRLARL